MTEKKTGLLNLAASCQDDFIPIFEELADGIPNRYLLLPVPGYLQQTSQRVWFLKEGDMFSVNGHCNMHTSMFVRNG